MKEKTADEMFEKLGYKIKHQIYNDEVILIGYTKEDEPAEECSIMFLKKAKKVLINIWADMQELQAINEKCKELGWLDE